MTKKIKSLEKETTQWRGKWESNNQALLQMAEEVTRNIHTMCHSLATNLKRKLHDVLGSSDKPIYGADSILI